jgi:hypothetical protein
MIQKRHDQGSKAFFFEKKTKKLLQVWARTSPKDRSQTNKSFLLLFFKKEDLALARSCPPDCPGDAVAITCHDRAGHAMIAAP